MTADDVEAQVGLLTEALKAIRTGQWTGPASVDAIYCALKGGLPQPDYAATWPEPAPSPALIANGPYFEDPNWPQDLDRYSARIQQLLGPAIARFARAQARLEVGDGQYFSTPYNFGNIGNTDDHPKGGGGFASPEAAADAWVAFITNNGGPTRYQAFLDAGRAGADVATLANLVAQAGYATGPNYAAEVTALDTLS